MSQQSLPLGCMCPNSIILNNYNFHLFSTSDTNRDRKRLRINDEDVIRSLLEESDSESCSDFDDDSVIDPNYSDESSYESDSDLDYDLTLPVQRVEEMQEPVPEHLVWDNNNSNFIPRKLKTTSSNLTIKGVWSVNGKTPKKFY